jgi:hypothetical protein
LASVASAQCLLGRIPSVGGVSINAEGVLDQPSLADIKELSAAYLKELKAIPSELEQSVELRKISLRAIEEAVSKSGKSVTSQLPDEIQFLAGIQRIQYILVYPEQNDIVLAGPGEGWKVDEQANVVGVTTGRPVLRLENLLVALRSVEEARQGGITVSIDPTAQGRKQFEQFMKSQKTFTPAVLDGIEKALGPQQVTITGVPGTSRFALTLAASDYKMKRIAMKLDDSPLAALPSFLDMMKKDRVKLTNMMPRWWMACNYQPLAKSEDGLAWELRGPGVKVLTEDEVVGDNGGVAGTGKTSPVAQKWATAMTEHYDELSAKEPIFGELRNLMDMCVVAALIRKEGLLNTSHLKLPTLQGQQGNLELIAWPAPKTVSTQCSFIKRDREYLITASGGVEIGSWEIVSKSVVSPAPGKVRQQATSAAGGLWWN